MSKFEFIKTDKILVESIQDECFQLANSIVHIPVATIKGKQILGKQAIEMLANNKSTNPEVEAGFEETLTTLLAPYMQTLISKQFPGFVLAPPYDGKMIKIIITDDKTSHKGELDAYPYEVKNQYRVNLSIIIIKDLTTVKLVTDTIFHELIHFCQWMLAPIKTTRGIKKVPPHIRYRDKEYMPNAMYGGWSNIKQLEPYENDPVEVEANMYDTVYSVMSTKARSGRGFAIIDRISKDPAFVQMVKKIVEYADRDVAYDYRYKGALLNTITDAIVRDNKFTVANKVNDKFTSQPAEDYISSLKKPDDMIPDVRQVNKVKILHNIVDTFVSSNINEILTQLKMNLAEPIPGITGFIG